MNIKQNIIDKLKIVEKQVNNIAEKSGEYTSVQKYSEHVKTTDDGKEIWTAAFQKAINENEFILIPAKSEPYYIDATVTIPSNRNIKAENDAVICQCENVKVLMFRNENTVDGTHFVPDGTNKDRNITITGGRWEESYRSRAGYGKSGMYDENRSFYGVSTCMLFNNIENLCLRNMTFAHTAGFSVQVGQLNNAVFENITFVSCYADGLHINGNTSNVVVRNVKGQVGDDLVAFNMYDWQDSSVNFGPLHTVLCENLELSEDSRYKALRIEPGVYYFDDASSIDCSVTDVIISKVKGVNTFKLYFQTPRYKIGTKPEKGAVGSGNNIFFENINVDLTGPIDKLSEYLNSDPLRGTFAAFEIGTNIKNVYMENINITMYKDKLPMSFLTCVGPKSSVYNNIEIFDPYLSSTVENLHYKNIIINGERVYDIKPYVKEIKFENINNDGMSTGYGKFSNIINED